MDFHNFTQKIYWYIAKSKFNELIENEDVEFPEIDKSLVKKSCLVIPIKYVSLIDVNWSYWLHLLSEDDS